MNTLVSQRVLPPNRNLPTLLAFAWKLLRSPLACTPFLLLQITPMSAAENPTDLQDRAREVLARALREESGFVRIHAAEALLDTGAGDKVRAAFAGAGDNATPAAARIGTWRVLALTSPTTAERDAWIARVRGVALDEKAADRLQAIETLGKLHVRLPEEELQAIRRFAVSATPAEASMAWWVLHLNGAPDALARIVEGLGADEPVARLRAAYVVKRDRLTGSGAVAALARAFNREPTTTIAYPYLLCAIALLADDAAQRQECTERLGQLLTAQNAPGKYEACLTLMLIWPLESVHRFSPVLESADADTRIGAAWAILHLARSQTHAKGP